MSKVVIAEVLQNLANPESLIPPVTYDTRPQADDLNSFVGPVNVRSIGTLGFDYKDDGNRIEIWQQLFPKWLFWTVMPIPILGMVAKLVYEWRQNGVIEWPLLAGLCLSPIAVVGFWMVISSINSHHRVGDVRAILDRTARTIELLDYGVTLTANSATHVVIASGLNVFTSQQDSEVTKMRTHEISIVGQTADGEWKRWVVLNWRNGSLEFFANEIAKSLNVTLLKCEV